MRGYGSPVSESSQPPAPCPACGHDQARLHWQRGAEQVWRCRRCGLMYRDPAHAELALSPEDRAERLGYAALAAAHDTRVVLEAPKIARLHTYAERLGVSLRGSRLLDVGAATGTLGVALQQGGWQVQYRGLEPDPAMRAHAPPDLDLLPVDLMAAELEPASADIVVLSDVLEHLPAPVEALERVRGWLRPGGMIYVEVPDESRLERRAALRRSMGMAGDLPTHPAHLSLFDRHTLAECLHRARFRSIDVYAVSIWTDPARIRLATPLPGPAARLAAGLFRATGLDRSLGQGALSAYARA